MRKIGSNLHTYQKSHFEIRQDYKKWLQKEFLELPFARSLE